MSQNILALCKEQKVENGFLWFYNDVLVIEMENLILKAYSEPFKMRLLRHLRTNSIMYREKFDENKEPYYEISQRGFEKLYALSKE